MSKFSISFGVTSTAQAIVGTSLIPKSGHIEHFFPSSSDKKLTRLSPLTGTIVPLKLFLNFFLKIITRAGGYSGLRGGGYSFILRTEDLSVRLRIS